jgi:diguanylate cyclase (GGDEF)-like protein
LVKYKTVQQLGLMSKFLSRSSEGWNCARDTAFNRLVSNVQANKLKYRKLQNTTIDMREELLSEETFKQYEAATIRDELTGLYNSHHFTQKLAKELKRAKRYKRPFSLMLVSMDKLPQLQKLYGNLLTNQILQQEAKSIISSVREVDLVFRIGQDQFAIIFPETYASKAVTVGERICEKTRSKSVMSGPNTVAVSVSVGISSFPTHGREDKELLAVATQFLEQAQRAGGNKVFTS